MTLKTYFRKIGIVQKSSFEIGDSLSPFRKTKTSTINALSIGKEPIMKRINLMLSVITIVLIFNPSILFADYSIYCGDNEVDYETSKYKQWAIMDVLDSLGLIRDGYWWSSPYYFWEDSKITWSSDAFDSTWADHTCVTVVDARSRTDKDPYTGDFYFQIETHYEWNGEKSVSNLWRYGAPAMFGESWGGHKGNCRYLILLGSDTVAIGPARSSINGPTYTRPDLFDENNSNHANPFIIWGPVITDGVRLVLGYTGPSYSSTADEENWKRFKDYYDDGFSIAECFAYTSLDADERQIPVALAQGRSFTAAHDTIFNERFFTSNRPLSSRYQTRYREFRYWYIEPLSDFNRRFYSSGVISHEEETFSNDVIPLNQSDYIYESFDSKKTETEYRKRYLDIFGLGQTDPEYEQSKNHTIYRLDNSDEARVDRQDNSFCYRNPGVYEKDEGSAPLTKEECIDIALSLLLDNSIITSKEIELDSVISVNRIIATEEQISRGVVNSDSNVIGYIAVFKRKLGKLPIFSNQVDTIKVEITVNGEVASLISNYKHGRILTEREVVQPLLATVKEARELLSWMGTIDNIEAGLLPLGDGDYMPVYKVTTSDATSTSMPAFTVQYLRQDTLEPVSFSIENAIDGYEIEDVEVE